MFSAMPKMLWEKNHLFTLYWKCQFEVSFVDMTTYLFQCTQIHVMSLSFCLHFLLLQNDTLPLTNCGRVTHTYVRKLAKILACSLFGAKPLCKLVLDYLLVGFLGRIQVKLNHNALIFFVILNSLLPNNQNLPSIGYVTTFMWYCCNGLETIQSVNFMYESEECDITKQNSCLYYSETCL